MNYIKTTKKDEPNAERRKHTRTLLHSPSPRRKYAIMIRCPFCFIGVTMYGGSWKRCPDCGALHSHRRYSIRRRESEVTT